jgi:lipopolysaccharide export system protein LptA
MNFTKFLWALWLFVIINLWSFNIIAKTPADNKTQSLVVIKITANFIDIKQKLQIIEFNGNVIVKKGRESILADKMILFYKENKSASLPKAENKIEDSSKIKKLEAIGNVRIFNGEFVATAKNGYYNPQEDLFILENDVIVNNGESIAKGNKFIYNFKTKKGNLAGKLPTNNLNKQIGDQRAVIIIGDNPKKNKKSNKSLKTN